MRLLRAVFGRYFGDGLEGVRGINYYSDPSKLMKKLSGIIRC